MYLRYMSLTVQHLGEKGLWVYWISIIMYVWMCRFRVTLRIRDNLMGKFYEFKYSNWRSSEDIVVHSLLAFSWIGSLLSLKGVPQDIISIAVYWHLIDFLVKSKLISTYVWLEGLCTSLCKIYVIPEKESYFSDKDDQSCQNNCPSTSYTNGETLITFQCLELSQPWCLSYIHVRYKQG